MPSAILYIYIYIFFLRKEIKKRGLKNVATEICKTEIALFHPILDLVHISFNKLSLLQLLNAHMQRNTYWVRLLNNQ